MRRREFLTLLGAAATWPVAARAQMPVIGLLSTEPVDSVTTRLSAFRRGLREAGYIEGGNVVVEYRSAGGQRDPLQGLAADLVRRRVNVM